MSEDTAQGTVELFDQTVSGDSEAATDAVSTTQEGEENNGLTLESKVSDADRQILAWEKKILSGERTLEDLRKLPNLKWVLEGVESKLNKKAQVQKVSTELNIDEILDAKLAEKQAKAEDDKLFEEQKRALSDLDLSKEQRLEIKKQFEDLQKWGVPAGKAAEKVALIAKGMVKPSVDPRFAPVSISSAPISKETARERLAEMRRLSGL